MPRSFSMRENALLILLLALSAFVIGVSIYINVVSDTGRSSTAFGVVAWCAGVAVVLVAIELVYRLCTAWTRRASVNRIVFGQIATVVRQNLPLGTAIMLAAESERGWARVHLKRIAGLTSQGASLSQAVRAGYPDCPGMVQALLVGGEQAGQLAAALDQVEEYLNEQDRRRMEVDVAAWPYVVIVLAFTLVLASGIMVAIVPKFKEIFKDFGTQLPGATILLIQLFEFLADWWIFVVIAVAAIPLSLYLHLRPRSYPEPHWTTCVADWIRWYTPGLRRLEHASGLAAMLGILRLGVRGGLGLPASARLAAGVDVNLFLRPRMLRFADMLSAGRPVREAASKAGLGEVAGVALAAGERSGDMEPALRYAIDYHSAFISRWWVLLRSMTWPVYTLCMGLAVAFVVVAIFQPLISLINAVSF